MHSMTVTQARKQLFKLVRQARDFHKPIHISGKKGGAVLVSEEDWSSIEETLYLLSIPGMRKSIRKGLDTPLEKCSGELNW